MGTEKTNHRFLTEAERYRLVKWVGLFGPAVAGVADGDTSALILLVLPAICTSTVVRSFRKINRSDLLRMLATLSKVATFAALASVFFWAAAKILVVDVRNFSIGMIMKSASAFLGVISMVDYWIESQNKLAGYTRSGFITDNAATDNPIIKFLEKMADVPIKNPIERIRDKFNGKSR